MSSEAMEPTLRQGQIVVADRTDGDYSPRLGDVVVVETPASWGGHTTVFRVIGVPGSTVQCCDGKGRQIRDGSPIDEPYLLPKVYQRPFGEMTVPAGSLWLEGDRRDLALDSRTHLDKAEKGMVPIRNVIGVVRMQ